MRLLIGITGASGAIYGIRLLEVLAHQAEVETHLIISPAGEKVIREETSYPLEDVRRLAHRWYDINDTGATLASGSFLRDGMIILPCTIKTMSALAHSYTDNLLTRAGDVTLKERKPLILAVRETPLHLGHLRNLVRLAEMGAIILPPVPGFYHHPQTISHIIDYTVGKALDLLGIKHDLTPRWSGGAPSPPGGKTPAPVEKGEERTRVQLSAHQLGKDLIVFLHNQNAHLGAVAIGEFDSRSGRVSTSVLTLLGHKDDAVAQQAAHRLSKQLSRPVCVIAGLHLDQITPQEIDQLLSNARMAVEQFAEQLSPQEAPK